MLDTMRAKGYQIPEWEERVAQVMLDIMNEAAAEGDVRAGRAFYYTYPNTGEKRLFYRKRERVRKKDTVLCGARTRRGTECRCLPEEGKQRCKWHGGCSTGPRTEAGREAIRESNRRRAKTKEPVG